MKELSFRHLDTSQLEIDLNWDPFINTTFNTKLVEDIHFKLSDEELIFSLSADLETFKELYEKFPQVQLHGKFFAGLQSNSGLWINVCNLSVSVSTAH